MNPFLPSNTMISLHTRRQQERREKEILASYAVGSGNSLGRVYPEPEHELRTCFQRDRDRIIHSVAFRRLEYKTQVFINGAGDHYRTRLTHTLEVAQIARTMGRILGVNEDLCEAVALAHDLGHPPFGHVGERTLNQLLESEDGFEHNAQALRIVDWLEKRYPDFPGLNLTAETRRGILKNKPPYPGMGKHLVEFLPVEAQIVDIADEISYNSHDLDDGFESGLLRLTDMMQLPLWREAHESTVTRFSHLDEKRRHYQIIIHLINSQVQDVVQETVRRLQLSGSPQAEKIVDYSREMREKIAETKTFLKEFLYRHPKVLKTNTRCCRIVTQLFEHYAANPEQLPNSFKERVASDGVTRSAADYVSGMTDRFAEEEYRQLFGI